MVNLNKPLVVGLTGAIGAGKSTVAKMLSEKGVPIVDADAIGQEVLETSERARRELRTAFGPSVFTSDGLVDKVELARAAFASREAVERLNAAVHPALWERIKGELASYRDADVVAIDAALIVEWGGALPVDLIVVVEAPEESRQERSRLKYGADDFRARQSSQLDAARKRARADVIVDNAGSLGDLASKVDRLYNVLSAVAGGKALPRKPLII